VKRGLPKWLQQKTLFKQMADDTAVKAKTAYRMQVKDILKKKDLSEEERKKQIKTIGEQMKGRYESLRSTKARIEKEQERQRQKKIAAAESDKDEDSAEKKALFEAILSLDVIPEEEEGGEEKGQEEEDEEDES